ncbi:MAG: hypothetical protein QM619_17050 [Micropruina sp.]
MATPWCARNGLSVRIVADAGRLAEVGVLQQLDGARAVVEDRGGAAV